MELAKTFRVVLFCASAVAGTVFAAEPESEQWQPVRRLIGDWNGTASGRAGEGTVTRKYTFVMNGRFVHEMNTSRYPPQEKNKQGEVHEHWGIFSYDKAHKILVLRQFHAEGFVTTYRRAEPAAGPALLVFESETFENFSNAWKARESYEFLSDDEFIETFELAPPDKSFQVYSRNHFKRVAR